MAGAGPGISGVMQESTRQLPAPDLSGLLARMRRARAQTRASFDPVRVEAEFYDALYGMRSGSVENVAPLRAAVGEAPAGATAARPRPVA